VQAFGRLALLPAILAALLAALLPLAALAHEQRTVAGKYQFVVGWTKEPAIVNQLNGVDLKVTTVDTKQPVTGLDQTLKVQVAFGGGQPQEFALHPVFGQDGSYTADLIPTRAGDYVFTFSGKVQDADVNEKFESGPGRFNSVDDAIAYQVPPGSALDAQTQQRLADAQAAAQGARQTATYGLALGALGIVVGAIGVVLGLLRPKV